MEQRQLSWQLAEKLGKLEKLFRHLGRFSPPASGHGYVPGDPGKDAQHRLAQGQDWPAPLPPGELPEDRSVIASISAPSNGGHAGKDSFLPFCLLVDPPLGLGALDAAEMALSPAPAPQPACTSPPHCPRPSLQPTSGLLPTELLRGGAEASPSFHTACGRCRDSGLPRVGSGRDLGPPGRAPARGPRALLTVAQAGAAWRPWPRWLQVAGGWGWGRRH